MSGAAFDNIFPHREGNTAFGKYSTGQSYLNMLNIGGVMVANVTFEPGCHNNWYIRYASKGGGQILLHAAESGWFRVEGKAPVSLKPGSVVIIPANRKHWYGAKKDSWFSRVAIEVSGEDTSNEWYELISDEYYENL